MKQLRPHLTDEQVFVEQVQRQLTEGYHLAYCQDRGEVRALAGFRFLEFLAWGKVLYIDDLITDFKTRRNGHGGKLLKWVRSPDHRQATEVLKEMHLNDVRNAFDHSDYILYKDTFRIREGNKAKRDLFVSGSKEYELEALIPILELAINVALMLIGLTIDSIRSYTENKRIPSRMLENDPFQDMELIVEPGYGLTGFRSVIKGTIN